MPPKRLLLPLAAAGLALLTWLPLGLAGVPLDTPDGFLHLGWAVGWARQLAAGWWWPLWSDLNWAGAGTLALAIYPPLFRLMLGLPLLAGTPPDQALAGALLAVLLLHAAGAAVLARVWLRPGGWRWVLLGAAGLNPYLLVNLYVRGAWPEALAQAWLWWLALGLVGIRRQRTWGLAVTAIAMAGVVLSNWNAALLLLILWGLTAVALGIGRAWSELATWTGGLLLGLGVTVPFWLPALRLLPLVRPPIPSGLFLGEFFLAGAQGAGSFARLLWIQSVVLTLLLAARWLGRGRRADWLGLWGLGIAILAIFLMLPISQPIYGVITPLQRIQFPWRWLGPAWLGGLLWLCAPASPGWVPPELGRWRKISLILLCSAAAGGWFDALWRFRENLVGHAPSSRERSALRQLLACDPLEPCPGGLAALPAGGELAKRFLALPDGRIALTGVPDYTPAGVPDRSWIRRLQTFWIPNWPQTAWATFSGNGRVEQVVRTPRIRQVRVNARSDGRLRMMQWATPLWTVRVRDMTGEPAGRWSQPLPGGAGNADGWVEVPLQPGVWLVELRFEP